MSGALVSVRVRSTEAARCTVFARNHDFVVGRPITFDREDPDLSAMEYAAGALAADVVGTFRKVARERRVVLDEVEATIRGTLQNDLAFLGVVGESGEPSLKKLTLKIYAGSGSPAGEVRAAWEAALRRSPLATSLGPVLDIEYDFQIIH